MPRSIAGWQRNCRRQRSASAPPCGPPQPRCVFIAWNNGGVLSILIAGGPVNLDSAWFTGWRANNSPQGYTATSVTVNGYLGAALVGTVNHVTGGSFQQVDLSSLTGIDKIEIVSSGDSQWWLMDDLAYSAVPEPGSMILLGLGLAGLAVRYRRKKSCPNKVSSLLFVQF